MIAIASNQVYEYLRIQLISPVRVLMMCYNSGYIGEVLNKVARVS